MDGIWNRYNLKSTRRIYVFPQIETFEQEIVSRVIFMQDGAPPHISCFVIDVLNERFPDAWIGRGGPIPWPPRSPDLSPLNLFLCGYIKTIVYAEKIRNIQHLQDRITSAIETNTRHDSENVAGDRISFGRLQSYKWCTYWNVLR